MRKATPLLLSALVLMTACSDGSEHSVMERVTTVDIQEAEAGMPPAPPSSPPPPASQTFEMAEASADQAQASSGETIPNGAGSIPVGLPQIAYRYALGFRLPADAIKPLQERHADMCEARGPQVCRIISMRQADQDGDYSYGNLQLAVASGVAREFSKELEQSSGTVDGELVSSSIDGEDLSKQIVDTEARLRARTLLRDRLMDVLRTRRGTVAELVQAERSVAQVNQEIDQARSWLTEMRGRVAFSQMAVTYESGTRASGGFSDPIRKAWSAMGAIFGSTIAFLMMAFAVVLPLAILLLAGLWLWRRLRKDRAETGAAAQDAAPPATEV